jgi:hypothetical protein
VSVRELIRVCRRFSGGCTGPVRAETIAIHDRVRARWRDIPARPCVPVRTPHRYVRPAHSSQRIFIPFALGRRLGFGPFTQQHRQPRTCSIGCSARVRMAPQAWRAVRPGTVALDLALLALQTRVVAFERLIDGLVS